MPAKRLGAELHEQVGVTHPLGAASGRARRRASSRAVDASTSRESTKCGTSCQARVVRSAMTRQTEPTASCGAAAAARRLDVRGDDRAVRARAGQRVEVDPARRGEPPGLRRAPSARRGARRSGASRGAGTVPARDSTLSPAASTTAITVPDRDLGALRRGDAGERAVGGRLDLDRHLVGLDLEQRLALRDALALRLAASAAPCPSPAPSRAPA